MTIRPVRVFSLISFLAALLVLHVAVASAAPAADYSHARVVRLSLVQGEVKVSRTGGTGDALGQNLAWEQAMINLPIREGFVLATGQGRTEVEFESGAAAYLAENSVLQFTELALSDGARITRLTLTQGTATIYANPSREDSFTVKTPSLEVALTRKGRIRVDTYDDGVSVSALHGEADITSSAGTRHISKGQSLSLRASDPNNVSISSIPKDDEWDRWVANREESVQSTATVASNPLSSPYYQAGVADLYSYGTFISYGGYNNCWRPRGVGFGWTPFSSGMWSFYPGFGWTWVSTEPWGWLPYHFGGWVYSPVYGWLWVPGQTHLWQVGFRPATAVFVQVNNRVGWLPSHPLDRRGDTPLNMEHGVFTNTGEGSRVGHVDVTRTERIQVLADAPRGLQNGAFRSVAPPERVSRRLVADEDRTGEHAGSGIVYDPRDRRFVNSNTGRGANSNSDSNPNVHSDTSRSETAPRGNLESPARIDRPNVVQDDRPSTGHDGENPARTRNRVPPSASPASPETMHSTPPTPPRSSFPSSPAEPSAEPSRPSRPESTVVPEPPAQLNRSRTIWHDEGQSTANDGDNPARSGNRMPPHTPPETMRSTPPTPSTPPRSSFPSRSEPRAETPRPMPPPRVEPSNPPSAPRFSPPPPPPTRQEQGRQNPRQQGHQDPH